jgi:hypothetical protein
MVSALAVYRVREWFRRFRLISTEGNFPLRVAECFVDEKKNTYISSKMLKS